MQTAIEIDQLSKSYRRFEAVRGVSLSIPAGEFFGLLGPNGAGKTTLIKTIVGLAHPSSGTVRVFGMEAQKDHLKTKALIGYSPQEQNVDRYFTVRRTLEFQGGYYGLSRKERKKRSLELMQRFGLAAKSETEFWKLSGGFQKRVLIARSLIARPKILILDEPTAGVDVEQRRELWAYLEGLNRDGTTILLTTHTIDEAETLCDRVGIIDQGRIVELGSPDILIDRYSPPPRTILQRGTLEEVFLRLTGKSIYGNETDAVSHPH